MWCSKTLTNGILGYFYEKNYQQLFMESELLNINLVTPSTPKERIKMIDKKSAGFIYLVSSSNTTGGKGVFTAEQKTYFEFIKNMNLQTPILTGFGISNKESFDVVCNYTQGGIIGSAFVNTLAKEGSSNENIQTFIKSIRS